MPSAATKAEPVTLGSSEPLPEQSENSPRIELEFAAESSRPHEMAPAPVHASKETLDKAIRSRLDDQPQNWREELSERVDNYRRRRAHLRGEKGPEGNLELDFDTLHTPASHRSFEGALGTVKEENSGLDLDIGDSAAAAKGEEGPARELLSLEELGDETSEAEDSPREVEEMSLGEPLEKNPPMEILVDSPVEAAPEEQQTAEEIYLAPLGRRFMAGLADTLVLILGAALFVLIFWRFCGRLTLVPLNIAVLGLAAIVIIFGYFGAFTAIASATPGLLWMGCEVRNLDGDCPTVGESFWRAFGVLVSSSALMLGFIWACVDSDALTWHDRMSGTVITMMHYATGVAGVKTAN